MIENELEYREWCRKNELGNNAIGNYVLGLLLHQDESEKRYLAVHFHPNPM